MQANYWYQFSSQNDQRLFEGRYPTNHEFSDWVGMNPFKIISYEGDEFLVEDQTGGRRFVELSAAERINFFKERNDLYWARGFYIVSDVEGLLKSVINKRFWDEVGFNTFQVINVNDDGRTTKLAYLNKTGHVAEVNHTFTPAERCYFVKADWAELTRHRPRGGDVNQEAMDVLLFDDASQEVMNVLFDKDQYIDNSLLSSEMKCFSEVEGAIVFRIENEADRIRAIEMLQTLKWKN